jgi:hypothetical protein
MRYGFDGVRQGERQGQAWALGNTVTAFVIR